MFSSRLGINISVIFSSLINFIFSKPKRQRNNTHDYTQFVNGRDYVFELRGDQTTGQMTAQAKDVKCGDYIILQNRSGRGDRYQVEEIDYYSDPPDMWMALLKRVAGN